MKQKLTLTVAPEIVQQAKKIARERGVSVSQMFEEAFQSYDVNLAETASQKAAKELLRLLQESNSVPALNDKELILNRVNQKYG
jgi:hypothetical protein